MGDVGTLCSSDFIAASATIILILQFKKTFINITKKKLFIYTFVTRQKFQET